MIDDNLTSSKATLPKLDRIFSTYGVTQVDWLSSLIAALLFMVMAKWNASRNI